MDQQTEELIAKLTTENHRLYNENLGLNRKIGRRKKSTVNEIVKEEVHEERAVPEYECDGECNIKGICRPCFSAIANAPSLHRRIVFTIEERNRANDMLDSMTDERDAAISKVERLQRAYDGAAKKSDEHRVICDSLKNEIADIQSASIEERREFRERIDGLQKAIYKANQEVSSQECVDSDPSKKTEVLLKAAREFTSPLEKETGDKARPDYRSSTMCHECLGTLDDQGHRYGCSALEEDRDD